MKPQTASNHTAAQGLIKPAYVILLALMTLSGMAQMPIFKRYYIADIPGFGWLAQFYVTHILHYAGATLLLFLFFYCIGVYFGRLRRRFNLTGSAYVRIALLTAIAVTGIFRVLKNLPDVVFSPGFTMLIDISHLAFMLTLMVCGTVFVILKRRWLAEKSL
ncbi:MAG: FeS-binding protein [Desulfobacterales bacterium]